MAITHPFSNAKLWGLGAIALLISTLPISAGPIRGKWRQRSLSTTHTPSATTATTRRSRPTAGRR
ncbi:MAG: hypothetical protein MJA27_24275 [Pseudanabaenales cyanobacterium]|nr:hypothetical protein [Pseudanabaenales cyanobacterium]